MALETGRGVVIRPADTQFSYSGPSTVLAKLVGAQTGGIVFSQTGSLDPGVLIPPHTHSREDEIGYVLDGELTIELGDEILQAPAGSVVWRPRGQRHAFWNATDKVAHYFEVITPADVEGYFQGLARLLAAGSLRMEDVLDVARAHGVEFDMQHAGELISRFNLRPPTG